MRAHLIQRALIASALALVSCSCGATAAYVDRWQEDHHNWYYWDGSYPENPMEHVDAFGAEGERDGYVRAPLSQLQPEHSPDVLWPAYTVDGNRDPEQDLYLNACPILRVRLNDVNGTNLGGGSVYFFIGHWTDDYNYVFWYYDSALPVNWKCWNRSGLLDMRQDRWVEIVRVGMAGVIPQDLYNNPQQYGLVIRGHTTQPSGRLGIDTFASIPAPDHWPMKQRDMHNTGRADFTVPADRLNESFFDVILWQKPTPRGDNDGKFGSTSMTYYGGVGPGASDLTIGTYSNRHGIQGMDRHTGRMFWAAQPSDGSAAIADRTGAFSPDGNVIYITNDSTSGDHPAMAFFSLIGPHKDYLWHNGANPDPLHLRWRSPTIAPDGNVFLQHGRPYAGADDGSAIDEVWGAVTDVQSSFCDPALYESSGQLTVVVGGASGYIRAYNAHSTLSNERWSVDCQTTTDASVTIDPANGNIYAHAGDEDIYVVGLDINGNPLWSDTRLMVYDHVENVNKPQRVRAAGCLSHDGGTYYFQTTSIYSGEGTLYAVNTADGSLKWAYKTGNSTGSTDSSCPIVTEDGVIVVGAGYDWIYYAIQDQGNAGVLLDSLAVEHPARCSATLGPEGVLYLPIRTQWYYGNGNGDIPTHAESNCFTAFDLRSGAVAPLPLPSRQRAFALNSKVELDWGPTIDPEGKFAHYAIYRSEDPFLSVEGMTPLATVGAIDINEYTDFTAVNDTSYYYAVTAVGTDGSEFKMIKGVGPRTPRDETDLQVVSISRTPYFPRYCVDYTSYTVTDPCGFGPYSYKVATGLCGGQEPDTPRWPELGEAVTYTATIRNRGTNVFSGSVTGHWHVDGGLVHSEGRSVTLDLGETTTFSYERPWDHQPHPITFQFDLADDRAGNNALHVDTMADGFLSYIDRSQMENFRESTNLLFDPCKFETDDFIDWLNHHMHTFNDLFADAECLQRVRYDTLVVIDDYDPDPVIETIFFAVFPFRFGDAGITDHRGAYYYADHDIDYGLLHEWAHQLGLIDLYQLNLEPHHNQVTGVRYRTMEGLMNGVSRFISEHSARAMNYWFGQSRGYFGQYIYCMPENMGLRIVGPNLEPLEGAHVTVYQYLLRPGLGKVMTTQVKAQGRTNAEGIYWLPNVPLDPAKTPPTMMGDQLQPNPFGYLHMVGHGGTLYFEVQYNNRVQYFWFDVTEANLAYWDGQTTSAVFDRQFDDFALLHCPPREFTELNAFDWEAKKTIGSHTSTLTDDTANPQHGQSALKLQTSGGSDIYLRYPATFAAQWDFTDARYLTISFRTDISAGMCPFQDGSPWIRLKDEVGRYAQYQYYRFGEPYDLLNETFGGWHTYQVPLDASETENNGWRRTLGGEIDLTNIHTIEIHNSTDDCPYTLNVDNVRFDLPAWRFCDFHPDAVVSLDDLLIMVNHWLKSSCTHLTCQCADLNQDRQLNLMDLSLFAQQWMLGYWPLEP